MGWDLCGLRCKAMDRLASNNREVRGPPIYQIYWWTLGFTNIIPER